MGPGCWSVGGSKTTYIDRCWKGKSKRRSSDGVASSVLHYIRESLHIGVCFRSLKASNIVGTFVFRSSRGAESVNWSWTYCIHNSDTAQRSRVPNWTAARRKQSRMRKTIPLQKLARDKSSLMMYHLFIIKKREKQMRWKTKILSYHNTTQKNQHPRRSGQWVLFARRKDSKAKDLGIKAQPHSGSESLFVSQSKKRTGTRGTRDGAHVTGRGKKSRAFHCQSVVWGTRNF